jgi:hypothetical protein
MCWSGEASAAIAAVGISTAIYAAIKKEPISLWVPLGYFSLMEILQALTYRVIDQCDAPMNQIYTLFGYLHIAFQPFFINMLAMHFIPAEISKKISFSVYVLCAISVLFMLVQLYPFDWAGQCTIGARPLCGSNLCSISGNWHIAWSVPANGIGNYFINFPITFLSTGYISYELSAFILPILYGSWRLTLYHLILGPRLALLLTDNVNEWPAVWCLLSVGIIMLVVKTPLRSILYVKSWIFWPRVSS